MENTGLLKKLWEIQKAVRGLLPEAEGGTGNYKYVSGSKLLGIIRPKMDELGLILKPEITDITNMRQDYHVGRDQRPKAEIHTSLHMRFTWIDVESGEREVCEWAANGQNDWDKGAGSAMTYGERYFLMKFFHIPTDEDDVDALQRPDKGDAQSVRQKTAAKEKPAFNPGVLEDEVSVNVLCKWIERKEQEWRADNTGAFKVYGLMESAYMITPEEASRVVRLYEDYKSTKSKIS